jgi:DNA-binding NarL/FixJ family response regulator
MSASADGLCSEQGTVESCSPTAAISPSKGQVCVCLVGGSRIVRAALRHFLQGQGVEVASAVRDETALAQSLVEGQASPFDVIVLLLTGGVFQTFHQVQETLRSIDDQTPLLVLSDRVSRGQVYAALRTGAKAFVHLDSEPAELVRGIQMAAAGKTHLSPDAAQLLVKDITTADELRHAHHLPNTRLSPREVEIVQLLCEGLSSKEVARRLHIAAKTVENHRYNIYRKCEVDSIAGLMRHAIQQGLVSI